MHTATARLLKARGPADFLAAVPQLVGFVPEGESLVLVLFRGRRSAAALRLDVPEASSPLAAKRLATTMMGMICKVPGIDGVAPVVYTDRAASAASPPHAEFIGVLTRRLRHGGFEAREALCVAANGWVSYLAAERGLPRLHDLAEIEGSWVHERLKAERPPELRSPEQHAALPEADAERAALVRAEYERIDALLSGGPEGLSLLEEEFGELCEAPLLAERVLAAEEGARTPAVLALLCRWVVEASACDAVLLGWAFGVEFGRYIEKLNVRHARGEKVEADAPGTLALAGIGMPRPGVERIMAAISVLRAVIPVAPEPARTPLETMLAWLHWALGRGSAAGIVIDRVRARDPGYGLARSLDGMVSAGLLPEWVFSPPLHDEGDLTVAE